MHILQIYKDYHPVLGGIENHVRDIAEGLAERGHRVTVLVTSLTGRTEVQQPWPGLTVLKAARVLHLASTPLSLAMPRLARDLRPDLVHLHFPYPPGDLVYWQMHPRPPLVVTYHSDIVRQQLLLRAYRPLMELTLRSAARILPTSPNYMVSSAALRRHAARCSVVPLGIDTARFGQPDPRRAGAIRARYGGAQLLLFVGRLRYYKGLHYLLEAMPQIRGELLIGGSGPERERLQEQARRLGVGARVHFLGDVPDDELPALFQAADVFVMPAHLRAEALGLAQIEALASGLPCVSTELGTGTSFANLHGVTGLVVPPASPPALAGAIGALLADRELRQRYGAAGQRRARELFSQPGMLGALERVYHEVVTRR